MRCLAAKLESWASDTLILKRLKTEHQGAFKYNYWFQLNLQATKWALYPAPNKHWCSKVLNVESWEDEGESWGHALAPLKESKQIHLKTWVRVSKAVHGNSDHKREVQNSSMYLGLYIYVKRLPEFEREQEGVCGRIWREKK